jgi:hypothetical protein
MQQRSITIVFSIGIALGALMLGVGSGEFHMPMNQQGYAPDQPMGGASLPAGEPRIAFSHRLHAGELAIDCQYCHSAAEDSRHAGIPAAGTCMNCHKIITSTLGERRAEDAVAEEEKRKPRPVVNPDLRKLYESLALDVDNNFAPLADRQPEPIRWVKVHNLPSFVYFDHRAHIAVGVECQECHGLVETMERVRQVESLAMGWCVDCHRDANADGVNGQKVNASIDCDVCHH